MSKPLLRYTVDDRGMGYVYLAKDRRLAVVKTVEVGPRFHIDLDYKDRPIGVEIFSTTAESIFVDALYALATWIHAE